jgi:hypothetical protein
MRTFGYVRRRWFAQKDWPREVTPHSGIDLVPENGDTVQLGRSSFSTGCPQRGGKVDFAVVVEEQLKRVEENFEAVSGDPDHDH